MGIKRLVWGSVLALAATFAFAGTAAAATTDYPPESINPDIRDFSDSAGGWTASVDHEGPLADLLCILAPLTCPSVNNDFAPTGGAEGGADGYLRTQISGVAGVLTETTITWQSPAFTYNGAAGETPDEVFFTFDRRTDAGALVEVLQNGHIDIYLDNVTDGDSLKIVDGLDIEDVNDWTSLPAVDINPSQLDLGEDYRIRIEAVFDIPVASVLPDAELGYDNILLRASKVDPGDQDSDGDGVLDGEDNCIFIPNPNQQDTDGDGVGDLCDPTPTGPETDPDGDGVPTGDDNCPLNPNPGQEDADGDGAGDVCDPTPNGPDNDIDDDGIDNADDNCPVNANPNQEDADNDGVGDLCDPTPNGPDTDLDNDGIDDDDDNCPTIPNASQTDTDNDGVGDACDPTPTGPDNDLDNDGVNDDDDNCPTVPNTNQTDTDNDGVGDACDPTPTGPPGPPSNDPDGDGVPNPGDNCPLIANPNQQDTDQDGIGDACDPTPEGGPGGQVGGNQAIFDGRNLFIRMKCFGVSENGKCSSRVTIFKTKGGTRYTFPVQRIVPAKGGKVVRARIRFQFRSELENRKSVVMKSVLRTSRQAKERTIKYKTLELIKR